ncbi:MAG TPA: extracellular solute-binding protein [Candidatus Paceibacterota bacterium]
MNINKLQIILIGGAVFLTLIVVLIFSGVLPGLKDNTQESATLELWGFDDDRVWDQTLRAHKDENPKITVNYKRKTLENFETELLNAIARGDSPDIFILPSEYLKKFEDKISSAPPILITEREVEQQFVESAKQFLTPQKKVLGIPLYADPLVLYWNKDIFTRESIALPPKTWDEFLQISQKITKKDNAGNITVSGAALGRAKNIKNAPAILTALFLQSGEKIINEENEVVLGESVRTGEVSLRPAESALRFFSEFADSGKTSHSWVSSLPEAEDLFLSGKLGMYIGFSSEYEQMRKKNPHTAIGMAHLPNLNSEKATYGSVFAPVVPLASQNYTASWQFIKFLTSKEISKLFSDSQMSASPRRDLFSSYQSDSVRSVFAESNLSLKSWPNPNPTKTNAIFSELMEDMARKIDTMRALLTKAANKIREINKTR